jgi:hypothetical protein
VGIWSPDEFRTPFLKREWGFVLDLRNADIIKQGYGFAYTKYPCKYLKEFRQYDREVRENRRGLWR